MTTAEHRYLMAVIATASNPRFTVSRVDIDRPGADLHRRHPHRPARRSAAPGVELFFITGADALAQILTWKDAEELFALAHFIGVTRPGHTLTDDGLPADRVSLLEVPAMAISSTDCRERVTPGRAGLVPRARRRRAVRRQAPPLPGDPVTSPRQRAGAGPRWPR